MTTRIGSVMERMGPEDVEPPLVLGSESARRGTVTSPLLSRQLTTVAFSDVSGRLRR